MVTNDDFFICPFHNDTKPSAKYYEDSNSIYCFSCNKRWDIITTTQRLANCGFVEALDKIIDISINKDKFHNIFDVRTTQITKKTNLAAEAEYENTIKYCKTLEEILEDFREKSKVIKGYKNGLYANGKKYLELRGIDYEKCKPIIELNNHRLGFNYYQNENSFYYDYGRKDGQGYIIQRHINKWVREPGTYTANQKFNRGTVRPEIIYTSNEPKTRDYYKNKTVVIVEGIMDALSLISMSSTVEDYVIVVLNSTANLKKLFKTVNDELQFIDELDKYSKFKLCLDSDKAGQKATEEFIECYKEISNDEELDSLSVFDLKIGSRTFNDLNDWWVYYKNTYLEGVA
jgi:hypothetical protein